MNSGEMLFPHAWKPPGTSSWNPHTPHTPWKIISPASHDTPPQEEAPQGMANSPGPAAWPHSRCARPQAHAPLGPKDTNRHNNECTEAAGTDTSQYHNEGNKGLTAEAKAAFTVGSSCRNKATRPGASHLPVDDLRSSPTPNPSGSQDTSGLPCLEKGETLAGGLVGGGTCSRDEQKGQTYQTKGVASWAGVRLGTGSHVQPPALPHTSRRNSLEDADLTVGL